MWKKNSARIFALKCLWRGWAAAAPKASNSDANKSFGGSGKAIFLLSENMRNNFRFILQSKARAETKEEGEKIRLMIRR
jgi:hypothetical protein